MAKKATFQQVARIAGVSGATVSRVAMGSAHVSPEISERVKQAALQLGVDLLRRNAPKVIAFILGNRGMLHSFHSHILVGTEAYCAARGWSTLFLTLRYLPGTPWKEVHLPQILERRDSVGGFILAGTNSTNLLDLLKYKEIPFAVLGNNVVGEWSPDEHDVVWFSDIEGACEVTCYLLSLGHRDIWYVGNTRLPWFVRRYEGYARAMQEAGANPKLSDIDSDNDQDIGFLATKAILTGSQPVSAIFAGSDGAAEGVYKAVRDSRLRIPRDISVAGFNDTEASLLHPHLTSVRVFTEQLGKHLAELVLNRIEFPSRPRQHFTIPTQLVRRESCQPFSAATDGGVERSRPTQWIPAP